MKETWKQWLNEKGYAKWLKRDNLIILVLTGILLFIIALPTKDSGRGTDEGTGLTLGEKTAEEDTGLGNVFGKEGADSGSNLTEEEYASYLERKLEETLSGIYGVGEVDVMLTLASTAELVVEKDEPYSRSQTNETDSEGGSRIITQMEGNETTIYSTNGSSSEPYVVKTLYPRVEGVVVVAQGAGKGTVNKSITEIVQALFGLEAHKVMVVKMKETN